MISDVFGLQKIETGESEILDQSLQLLIDMRNNAKQERNFALSDEIRDKLNEIGVQLKDGKDGTTYSL
jgi:cysteinyl-tRNA synthetase